MCGLRGSLSECFWIAFFFFLFVVLNEVVGDSSRHAPVAVSVARQFCAYGIMTLIVSPSVFPPGPSYKRRSATTPEALYGRSAILGRSKLSFTIVDVMTEGMMLLVWIWVCGHGDNVPAVTP